MKLISLYVCPFLFVCLFYLYFSRLYFWEPSLTSFPLFCIFFAFSSCSRVLIFLFRPFFWLFKRFYSFLPCCPSLLSFVLFPSSFLLSGAQVSTSCPQSAPFSSYSAVPSTTFLSSRLLLRCFHKGQKYETISYARRGLMDCPIVPKGSPTVHVCISSKSNWVLWCRSFCQTAVSPSTYICVDILLRKQ